MATHTTWADCASHDPVAGAGADGGGPLTFDAPFAHSLKAGPAFSPVSFDGDGAPPASIDFMTLGVKDKPSDALPGTVFAATPVAAIPEPHTNLLMLAGLAAIGFMATRRRRP